MRLLISSKFKARISFRTPRSLYRRRHHLAFVSLCLYVCVCVSAVLIEFETFRANVATKEKGNARIMTILIIATADDWSACHTRGCFVYAVCLFLFLFTNTDLDLFLAGFVRVIGRFYQHIFYCDTDGLMCSTLKGL